MALIHWVKNKTKQKSRLWVHDSPILKVIFATLTENSSVVTNDTQGSQKYPHHIVGTPPALLKGWGYDLQKIESLGGGGVHIFLLKRGDKPEKGGGLLLFCYFTVQFNHIYCVFVWGGGGGVRFPLYLSDL